MPNDVLQVSMEKAVYFFGTVVSFLLSIIIFFLYRYVNGNDEAIKELYRSANDHEARLQVIESDKQ